MTKSFSTLIAALAISTSLCAATAPAFANEATRDTRSIGSIGSVSGGGGAGLSVASDLSSRSTGIANGDLGFGRSGSGITSGGPISGTDLGSGRVTRDPISGTDLGSGR